MLHRLASLLLVVGLLLGCTGSPDGAPSEGLSPAGQALPRGAASAQATNVNVALGVPVDADPSDDFIIARSTYVVSYNPKRLGPNWAAWRLVAADFGGARRHRGHFITDQSLPAGWYRVTHADYTDSGYDRGHLVRSEDRTSSDAANASTFLLTNVLPQTHALNEGPWLRLEDHCRTLAQHDGRTLYIVAGGLYSAHPATIGHGVAVPDAFWKVVVVLGPGQGAADVTPSTPVIAVVMPNVDGIASKPWASYRTTLAEVERRSGYRLLGAVPEAVRSALEAE
jgi:endonuclease G